MSKFKGKRYRIDLFRLTAALIALAVILGLIWLGVSWIDVVSHNCTDQDYATWNAWVILFREFLEVAA